nr:MAG TPA: hypothetical protein [Caudoviricetes sp.]
MRKSYMRKKVRGLSRYIGLVEPRIIRIFVI